MKNEDFRTVRVTMQISIRVPRDCTPEEEQALIDKFKAEHDLDELEKEAGQLAQMLRQRDYIYLEDMEEQLGLKEARPEKIA
jgi:hypothetical protein